jgi:hypothetical protein
MARRSRRKFVSEPVWWSCPSWCERVHSDSRPDAEAGVIHSRTVSTMDLRTVEGVRDEEDGPLVDIEQHVTAVLVFPVAVTLRVGREARSLTHDEVRALAGSLMGAIDVAVSVSEGTRAPGYPGGREPSE